MIETYALRSFGDVVTDEWLANIRDRHEECRKELMGSVSFDGALRNFGILDRKMHRDIVEALDNRAILETHARLQENLNMAKRVHQRSVYKGQLLDTVDEHLKIITSLDKRDVDGAAEALADHFRWATHRTYAI